MEKSEPMSLEKLFVEMIDRGEEELFLTRSRDGIFAPALVMYLEMSRRISGGSSLETVLGQLHEGSADEIIARNHRGVKARELSANSGGLCRARQRLKLEQVESACNLISSELLRLSGGTRWHGKRAYLLDGTSFTVRRTKESFAKYSPKKDSRRVPQTSQVKCSCIVDLFTGVAVSPGFGPLAGADAVGETTLGKQMLERLAEPGVVIADAGFGIFGVTWAAHKRKHDVLVRLSKTRAAYIKGARLESNDFDAAVQWRVKDRKNHPEIPEDATISGRLIKKTIRRDGYRPLTLFFFTTTQERVEELLALYLQRERIENDIRSLKYTLGMELLSGKSPAVLEKELLLGVAANNLVRAVAAFAAKRLNIEARRISFSRAVDYTRIFGNKLRNAHSTKEQESIIEQFCKALYQTKLPNRTARRLEPRKVARERSVFPLMKKSRQEERQDAKKIAKKFGHRGFFSTVSRTY